MSLTTWLPRGRPKDGRLPSVDNFQGSRHSGSGDRVRNTATKFSETGSIGGVRPPNQTPRYVVRPSCTQQGNRPAGATDRPTTRETAQATRSNETFDGKGNKRSIQNKSKTTKQTHDRPVTFGLKSSSPSAKCAEGSTPRTSQPRNGCNDSTATDASACGVRAEHGTGCRKGAGRPERARWAGTKYPCRTAWLELLRWTSASLRQKCYGRLCIPKVHVHNGPVR